MKLKEILACILLVTLNYFVIIYVVECGVFFIGITIIYVEKSPNVSINLVIDKEVKIYFIVSS